jgi:putative transposase
MRSVQFAKGNFYHIYNRGVEKRNIFVDDNDRWRFLQGLFLFNDVTTSANLLWDLERSNGLVNFSVLRKYFSEHSDMPRKPLVRIMADCLMPNHYHLLFEELEEGGISKFMHKLGTGYTIYFNKKYQRVGSLLQGTFKAKIVENDDYLKYILVYINVVNPGQLIGSYVKEEGVADLKRVLKFAKDYLWSTNREYLGLRESIIVDKGLLGEFFSDGKIYEEFIKDTLPQKSKFDNMKDLLLE